MSSEYDSKRLFIDRVEFKLYATEHHLNNLKEIEMNYGDITKDVIAIPVEVEIDCFLAQIVGAIDALLIQINIKLDLEIAIEKVDLNTIQSALNSRTKNISLLTEVHQASAYNNWLWLLRELRNQTMYRSPLRRMQDYDPFDGKTRTFISKQQTKFIVNPDNYMNKDLIQYFRESIQRVRELVNTVRMKEPLLK